MAVGSLQNPYAVDVARGITERWPVLASLEDSLAIDMVTRMAHSAFVNSLFLGSTISKHIYTVYPVILCACFILQ